MATRRSQRVAIWVIAGAMILGTVGGFIAMMVAPGNEAKDKAALDAEMAQWSRLQSEYQDKVDAQARELSDKYFSDFSQYASRVATFSADEVKELKTEDLRVGDGEEVKGYTKLAAYYIGWNPSGEIFDGSIDNDKLKAPLYKNVSLDNGISQADLIEGWREGLIGMKIGGVRELTIPSEKAYGEQGSGEKVPANTPLKFVVMAVPKLAEIKEPEMPPLVKKEYQRVYGNIF